jgi:hypothetical protein
MRLKIGTAVIILQRKSKREAILIPTGGSESNMKMSGGKITLLKGLSQSHGWMKG